MLYILMMRGNSVLKKFLRTGAPGGIRTRDPGIRNPILYPAELQAPFYNVQ